MIELCADGGHSTRTKKGYLIEIDSYGSADSVYYNEIIVFCDDQIVERDCITEDEKGAIERYEALVMKYS